MKYNGNMIIKRFVFIICTIVITFCTSCNPASTTTASLVPITYASLCGLENTAMGHYDEGSVITWIKTNYGSYRTFNDTTIKPEEKEIIKAFSWGDVKGTNGIAYLRNGLLFRISIRLVDGPTFSRIIESFSKPNWLLHTSSRYEDIVLDLQIDYPEKGLSMGNTEIRDTDELLINGELQFKIDGNAAIQWIECYKPEVMQSVLVNVFFIPKNEVDHYMGLRIPWPGFDIMIPLYQETKSE